MSIADFLFASPVKNILRTVYSAPEQSFMLNELIGRAGHGRGNSQRHIERLIDAGVLEEAPRHGHQRSIRANKDFALYPELLSICRKSFGLLEPIREALAPFRSKISEAFLFGSVAKGSDTHQSDIDLMIIGNAPLLALTEAMFKVEQDLGRPVHLNVYAPEEWTNLKVADPVLSKISLDSITRILPDAASN